MSMHNLPWDVVAAWSTLVKSFVAFRKLICQMLWPGPVITGVFLHLIFFRNWLTSCFLFYFHAGVATGKMFHGFLSCRVSFHPPGEHRSNRSLVA